MNQVENTVSKGTSVVALVSFTKGMCLPSRCLETNVVSEPFASNVYFSGSTVFALRKYATIKIAAFLDLFLCILLLFSIRVHIVSVLWAVKLVRK
jgi:hypothetical protein